MVSFWKRDSSRKISDLPASAELRDYVLGQAGKVSSLQVLGRNAEASEILARVEGTLLSRAKQTPQISTECHLLLAVLYSECGLNSKLEPVLKFLLESSALTKEQELIVAGALQNVRRQNPQSGGASSGPEGYTDVYCCRACGRLHNYVSMPCPHCGWMPKDEVRVAESIMLSTSAMSIADLVRVGRSLAIGRKVDEVVPNLKSSAEAFLETRENSDIVDSVLKLGQENVAKNSHSMRVVTSCPACDARIVCSGGTHCHECGKPLNLSGPLIALNCFDLLLALLETRVEVSPSNSVSEFIRLLVRMESNLLRRQEPPTKAERDYCLKLLNDIGALQDKGGGAVVDFSKLSKIKVYVVKSHMTPESEAYGVMLSVELEQLVRLMESGVPH